jgi:serine/threonine protein kinase
VESAEKRVKDGQQHKDFQKIAFQMAASLLHVLGMLTGKRESQEKVRIYGCLTGGTCAEFVMMYPLFEGAGEKFNLIFATSEKHWVLDFCEGTDHSECLENCGVNCDANGSIDFTETVRSHAFSEIADAAFQGFPIAESIQDIMRPDDSTRAIIYDNPDPGSFLDRLKATSSNDAYKLKNIQDRKFADGSTVYRQCLKLMSLGAEIAAYANWLAAELIQPCEPPFGFPGGTVAPGKRPSHTSTTPWAETSKKSAGDDDGDNQDDDGYDGPSTPTPRGSSLEMHQATMGFINGQLVAIDWKWKGKVFVVKLLHITTRMESMLIAKKRRPRSRELKMLSSIHHPNIVQLLRGHQFPKFLVLHEEYLSWPRWNPQQVSDVLPLTCGFALDGIAALQELKSHRIIHRDISPSNIRWSRLGNCWKLIDFDIAAYADENGEYRNSGVVGTEGYIAPEILEGKPFTFGSDLFSLASVAVHDVFCPSELNIETEEEKEVCRKVMYHLLCAKGPRVVRPDLPYLEKAIKALYGQLVCYYRFIKIKWRSTSHDHRSMLVALAEGLETDSVFI